LRALYIALLLVAALALPAAGQEAKGSGRDSRNPATVVVANRLNQGVSVWIDGEMKGRVEPSKEARFDRVAPGKVSLQAAALGSAGPVAGEERDLAPGETFTWTLYPVLSWGEEKGTGTVVLENGLDHDVEVTLGGSPAGSLAPGATRAYPRVVAGNVDVSARDAAGGAAEQRTLTVLPGNIARWEIGKGDREVGQAEAGSTGGASRSPAAASRKGAARGAPKAAARPSR
jgi:hypothetical protein